MMSRRIARLCLLAALVGAAALVVMNWQGSAQTFDRNDRPAVLRALASALGHPVNPDVLCIATPEHFPDLVIVRAVVPDAGCMLEGVFVRGRWQRNSAGLLDQVGKDALAARGWATADAEARRTLALQWVVEGLYGDRAVVDPARLTFPTGGANVTPPSSETGDGGAVLVRVWVVNATVAGLRLARVTAIIGPDGALGR